jgi:hypothetical protein
MAKRDRTKSRSQSPRKRDQAPNPGLPDEQTVVSERTFTSPKGKRYRIIRTTEKDPYDPPDDDKGAAR